jgi:hypothetical protein
MKGGIMRTACPCIIKGRWAVRVRENGKLLGDIKCNGPFNALLTAAAYNFIKPGKSEKDSGWKLP